MLAASALIMPKVSRGGASMMTRSNLSRTRGCMRDRARLKRVSTPVSSNAHSIMSRFSAAASR